ncbi:hypothetical protein G8764_17850 [Pseudomaricurvus alcaniphilus]|uniref:hypothetical protein n=1 Tax=Pseudomaricurvus alcaniphilus TaxID=1166482 RepID=UPI0014074A83|nr:hypothetical protein [Pseudomaricurvus alcaniphilus]NHN39173.1 hypothetical protein [Pseudomaricurvus alcaniphilus]
MFNPLNCQRLLLPLAISAALTACGGGGGGGDSSSAGNSQGGSSTSVSGSASKGIILNGVANAWLLTSTGDKGELVAGPVLTDSVDGSYELELDASYDGSPLLIEITSADSGETTLMKCDLAVCQRDSSGTPTVVFGDSYELAADFRLRAVSAGTEASSIAINVTPLTNVAAALTLYKVANGIEASEATLTTNAQIASKFGITGDITQQPIVDITNAESVNAASAEALEYNLKATAVVQAALGSSTDISVEDALDNFVDQYVNTGLADNEGSGDTDNPATVSLEEILASADSLLGNVAALEGLDGEDEDLLTLTSNIGAEKANADSSDNSTPDQGDIPDDAGSEGLVASKQFVQQVRNLISAGDIDGLQAFSAEIDMAAELTSADTALAIEGMALAMAAIAEAQYAYELNDSLTEWVSDGITVTISGATDSASFAVDQDVSISDSSTGVASSVAVDLSASVSFVDNIEDSYEESETDTGFSLTETASGNASAALAVSGTASTALVSVSLDEGSGFSASLTVDYEGEESGNFTMQQTETSYTSSDTWSGSYAEAITVEDLDMDLSVTIAQQASAQVTDPVSFTGSLSVSADLLSIDSTETEENTQSSTEGSANFSNSGDFSHQGTETVTVEGLSIVLSGEFSNSANTLAASVALAGSGFSETCDYSSSFGYLNNADGVNESSNDWTDECSSNETATEFASASVTVMFSMDVQGILDPIEVQAVIQRTGLEEGEANINISYGGNQLDFNYDGGDSLTVSNHNDVELTLTETETEAGDVTVSGTITQNGNRYATIDEDGGVAVITFSDGSFQSL